MINSFRSYLIEEQKTVFFTFGRMNPPTIGHGMLMDTLASKAGSNPYRIYLSHSSDPAKNPLDYPTKIKFARKMFPRHARSIILNKALKNVLDVVTSLYNEGFKNVAMVVGSDRIIEFRTILEKYNGVDSRHGFYKFQRIDVISAGERDPDSEGVEGASATKQRQAAKNNDFTLFSLGLPKKLSNVDAKGLFNAVRKGMGLKEEKVFKRHLEFEPVSEVREDYVKGQVFKEGQEVVLKSTDEIHTIITRGPNYLVLEDSFGRKTRKWLDDVAPLEERSSHRLNINLPLKHQVKHGTEYVDQDNDGDVDKFDAKTPGETTGVPDITKKLLKKNSGERKHTRIGVAFEDWARE